MPDRTSTATATRAQPAELRVRCSKRLHKAVTVAARKAGVPCAQFLRAALADSLGIKRDPEHIDPETREHALRMVTEEGMSQAETARQLGVSQSFVSLLVRGRRGRRR